MNGRINGEKKQPRTRPGESEAGREKRKGRRKMMKMNDTVNTSFVNMLKIAFIDVLIVFAMLMLPTISHVLSFPLYSIEPIRIAVLIGLIISANNKNAYILAGIIPLFSFLVAGHPLFCKCILISGEMILNIWLFSILFCKKINVFLAMICSIIVSKMFYYAVKALFIGTGILHTSLMDTNIWIQFGVMIGIACVFALAYSKSKFKIK